MPIYVDGNRTELRQISLKAADVQTPTKRFVLGCVNWPRDHATFRKPFCATLKKTCAAHAVMLIDLMTKGASDLSKNAPKMIQNILLRLLDNNELSKSLSSAYRSVGLLTFDPETDRDRLRLAYLQKKVLPRPIWVKNFL